MTGEENLEKLLQNLNPVLDREEYVFITVTGKYGDYKELQPLSSFLENEGLTLIIKKTKALEYDLEFDGVFNKITLEVHSSLNAVGLTAVIATRLKENDISANVIAAYFHDHIFIQSNSSEKAIQCLQELTIEK